MAAFVGVLDSRTAVAARVAAKAKSPKVDVLSFLAHTWRLFGVVAVSQNRSCAMVSATRNVFAWHGEGNRPRNGSMFSVNSY